LLLLLSLLLLLLLLLLILLLLLLLLLVLLLLLLLLLLALVLLLLSLSLSLLLLLLVSFLFVLWWRCFLLLRRKTALISLLLVLQQKAPFQRIKNESQANHKGGLRTLLAGASGHHRSSTPNGNASRIEDCFHIPTLIFILVFVLIIFIILGGPSQSRHLGAASS
jgi:hypothetical protein